jgi:hypothetical protein
MVDDSRRPGPRDPFLRMCRRHWLLVAPLVGAVTFVVQAMFASLNSHADVVGKAVDQALLNFAIAVVISIGLRVRYPSERVVASPEPDGASCGGDEHVGGEGGVDHGV